jgi:hypothetical protein
VKPNAYEPLEDNLRPITLGSSVYFAPIIKKQGLKPIEYCCPETAENAEKINRRTDNFIFMVI